MTQWLRAIELEVGEPGFAGLGDGFAIYSNSTDPHMLRVAFEIEKDERPWPNSAKIKIWNLNPNHRGELAKSRGIKCKLSAGYQDGTGVIFDGYMREARSWHRATDWITELQAGDGELNEDGDPLSTLNFQKTWARGTPVFQILRDFVSEMKLGAGNSVVAGAAATLLSGATLSHSYAVDGPLLDEFIAFMRSVNLSWSFQDGALQVRVGELPAGFIPLISPLTGLVGRPETFTRMIRRQNTITKKEELKEIKGVEGRCLLLPELRPGYQFILQSDEHTGPNLCTLVRHVGDTMGTDWYTEFEGQNAGL